MYKDHDNTICILHDYFAIRGGGERLVLALARGLPKAALVYGYKTSESFADSWFPECTVSFEIPQLLRRREARVAALAVAFHAWRNSAAKYPVRIFSGVAAPLAAPNKGDGLNIFYCHTPPRFLYDQRDFFTAEHPPLKKAIARILLRRYEKFYRRALNRMDVVIANSETTRSRIKKYLGTESTVIHPPVETKLFRWLEQGDFYLSTARLTPLKRVERIIDAFLHLPEKKLIVVSGGDEMQRLKSKAAHAPNITFEGWVSDERLQALMGRAIATIYLAKDEDFGMSPLESMAAGKPVIAVGEGGLLETVLPEKTGVLLRPDFDDCDLIDAICAMSPEVAASMRAACELRAAQFSYERFLSQMTDLISDYASEHLHTS